MSRRVLLVDDEPDVRAVARLSLELVGGWEVLEAPDGLTAVELARREFLDAVVLDVMMPGTDGPATFRLLAEDPRTASIPVVMLTARVDREDREQWLAMGVRGVLAKPFEPLQLAADIAVLLGWSP
ncbi:MAG: response regulator [Frankiales bacterium]|nr:response regulator [Frankiales bacterium]